MISLHKINHMVFAKWNLRILTKAMIAIAQAAMLIKTSNVIMATAENGNLFTYGTFECTLDAFLWRPSIHRWRFGPLSIPSGGLEAVKEDMADHKSPQVEANNEELGTK